MEVGTLFAFAVYLLAMLGIGLVCFRQTSKHADYILGGRRLGPAVAALSAGASDMSGWLLLGLPGAFYASGMNQSWIVIGLMIGIFLNWQFIAKPWRSRNRIAKRSSVYAQLAVKLVQGHGKSTHRYHRADR